MRAVPLALSVEVAEHTAAASHLYWIDTADTIVDRLRTWAALLAVGLVSLTVELTLVVHWRLAWLGEWVVKTAEKGLYLMLITPPVVLVVAAVLVLLARPGLRGATWRAARRPVSVAAFTLVFVAALAVYAWHGDAVAAFIKWAGDAMATDPLLYLVVLALAFAMIWFVFFLASALYLAQRNGLNHDRSLPLMAPLVQVLVIWLYLGLAVDVEPNHFTGWRLDISRYGTPTAITVLSIIEVIQLRRRFGVGFRDPFPHGPPPSTDLEPYG